MAFSASAGAQGVTGYQEVTTTTSITVPTTTTVSVSCPTGTQVVGGGYQVQDPTLMRVLTSDPSSTTGWSVTIQDTDKMTVSATVTAVCIGGSVPGYFQATNSASVAPQSLAQVSATCPTGDVVVGGGFNNPAGVPEDSSLPETSSSIVNNVWTSQTDTSNQSGNVTIGVTAICVASTISGYAEPTNNQTLNGGTNTTVTQPCAPGAVVLGGGASGIPSSIASDQPFVGGSLSNNTWSTDAITPAGVQQVVTVTAICANLAPTVTNVSPTSGPGGGGTSVKITGTNLTGASAVKFGSTAATSFTVNSATQITATSPAGAAGAVDVTVTTPGGTSATGAGDKYTYVATPTVTGVSPTSGVSSGGTSVTITGANLGGATAVKFGSAAATSFTVVSATKMTAISPAGSGTVHVTVTTAGGTSATSSSDQFSYNGPPTVTAVSPSSGPTAGGTSVIITGGVLSTATAVKFGSTPATAFTINSASQITATAPPGSAATVDVTVTTQYGTSTISRGDKFTYVSAPTVTGVSPNNGGLTGGTSVTITGTNLTAATAVGFGSIAASTFTVDTPTQITAVSPAAPGGIVDVTVTTAGGTSATSAADKFAFAPPPGPSTLVAPSVVPAPPSVLGTSGATFSASVNPNGAPTSVYFEYGLSSKYGLTGPAGVYTQTTPVQSVGSGSTAQPVAASVKGLVPNATYDVRAVATNSAGTATGPDTPFTTPALPAPAPPVIGKAANFTPVSGTVYIKLPATNTGHIAGFASRAVAGAITKGVGFVPLTEARQLPVGTEVDARAGTLKLVTATTAKTKHKKAKTQSGNFSGGLFSVLQSSRRSVKGLTTLTLLDSGIFPGAPSYSQCVATGKTHAVATIAKRKGLSKKVLQTLTANDHGNFVTKGKYSAATVRGTQFSVSDRCDGTLTVVQRGTVLVTDNRTRKNITLHAHQSYLAKAP